jgi:hypothetical protein
MPYLQYFNYLSNFPPSQAKGLYYNIDPVVITGRKPNLKNIIELFVLNSNMHNLSVPDQTMRDWFQSAIGNSTAKWKFPYFHHPPYCTAQHDPLADWMRWPFQELGAAMVITGHEHVYERLNINNFTYVVNGLGGK